MGFLAAGITATANIAMQERMLAWQNRQRQKTQKYNTEMSNTAYQRGHKDMIAAGLNPLLLGKIGPASSPTSAAGKGVNPANMAQDFSAVSQASSKGKLTAIAEQKLQKELLAIQAGIDLQEANTTLARNNSAKTIAQTTFQNQVNTLGKAAADAVTTARGVAGNVTGTPPNESDYSGAIETWFESNVNDIRKHGRMTRRKWDTMTNNAKRKFKRFMLGNKRVPYTHKEKTARKSGSSN